MPRCRIEVELPFSRNLRRDPHNYVSAMAKAFIGELVRQGCWEDERIEYVRVAEPVLVMPSATVAIGLVPTN
jgi:hypothetical protein